MLQELSRLGLVPNASICDWPEGSGVTRSIPGRAALTIAGVECFAEDFRRAPTGGRDAVSLSSIGFGRQIAFVHWSRWRLCKLQCPPQWTDGGSARLRGSMLFRPTRSERHRGDLFAGETRASRAKQRPFEFVTRQLCSAAADSTASRCRPSYVHLL